MQMKLRARVFLKRIDGARCRAHPYRWTRAVHVLAHLKRYLWTTIRGRLFER